MGLYLNGRQTLNTDDIIMSEGGIIGIGSDLERIEYDGSSGDINILGANVGIGLTNPGNDLEIAKSAADSVLEVSTWSATNSNRSELRLFKSSSNTIGTEAKISANEAIGAITAYGVLSGGALNEAAKIQFSGDNSSAGSNHIDSRIEFHTKDLTLGPGERLRIDSLGNVGIGTTSPNEKLHVDDAIALSNDAEGSTGRLTMRTSHETHTLAAATTSDTTTISIPSGARILAVSMTVNTTVVDDGGDDTWSAAFITGSTTTIVSGAAAAQNTKVNFIVPDEKASATAEIRFTANGGSFSAGVIEIIAYYEDLTSLAN